MSVIPGLLDFTHVLNTGAAFGFLNSVDFPFKTTLIAAIATAALIGVGLYSASLATHQLIARLGLALIVGGAAGNLIDRVVTGIGRRLRGRLLAATFHFWAFNVADSAITIGVAVMILDMLGHEDPCIHDCLRLPQLLGHRDQLRSTPTASCWPPPTCLGLKFAMVRAKARDLDQTRVLDLGIYIIISALIGAKLLLLAHQPPVVSGQPARTDVAGLVGRRLLRGPHSRGHRRTPVHPAHWPAAVDDLRCVRPWHRPRACHRTLRLLLRRMLLRQADQPSVGHHVHGSVHGDQRRHAPECPAPPHAALRGGAEALILGLLLATESRGRRFPGRTFWLYVFLYGISRYVIEIYRDDPRGMVGSFSTSQFISMILVPLAVADADLPRAASGARTATRPPKGGVTFTVPAESEGARLDHFLVSVWAEHSRSQIQRLIKDGRVEVEGRPAKANRATESRTARQRRRFPT